MVTFFFHFMYSSNSIICRLAHTRPSNPHLPISLSEIRSLSSANHCLIFFLLFDIAKTTEYSVPLLSSRLRKKIAAVWLFYNLRKKKTEYNLCFFFEYFLVYNFKCEIFLINEFYYIKKFIQSEGFL